MSLRLPHFTVSIQGAEIVLQVILYQFFRLFFLVSSVEVFRWTEYFETSRTQWDVGCQLNKFHLTDGFPLSCRSSNNCTVFNRIEIITLVIYVQYMYIQLDIMVITHELVFVCEKSAQFHIDRAKCKVIIYLKNLPLQSVSSKMNHQAVRSSDHVNTYIPIKYRVNIYTYVY